MLRRVRPSLGTFVEIRLTGANKARVSVAATRAFEVVAEIDGLMSFHRPESDMSRLNRAPIGEWVSVHARTRRVLAMSNKFFTASGGVFDVRSRSGVKNDPLIEPVEISGRRVRRTGDGALDLGGIAKGYAVDAAVAVLKRAGMTSGLVNAGGDLRAFGSVAWPIALRHPANPSAVVPALALKRGALATSGSYFARRPGDRKWNAALRRRSITVAAPTCMAADGLTKVVALAPRAAKQLLRRFRSQAIVMNGRGAVREVN